MAFREHLCSGTNCYSLELREGYSAWIVRFKDKKSKHHDKAILSVEYCPWCGVELENALELVKNEQQ